jgi:hypothetical protein
MRCLILFCATVLVAPLASCGYAPPAQTDTESPKYQADLDTCQSSIPDTVDRRNAKRGLTWVAGGVTRWPEIDAAIGKCMSDKGWGRVRACTPEERRTGTGNQTVTRDGVRCADPNRPNPA